MVSTIAKVEPCRQEGSKVVLLRYGDSFDWDYPDDERRERRARAVIGVDLFDDGRHIFIDESWWKDERRERRARAIFRDQHFLANLGFRNRAPIARTRKLKREDKRVLRASALSPGRLPHLSYAALRKSAASQRRSKGVGREARQSFKEPLQEMFNASTMCTAYQSCSRTLDECNSTDESQDVLHATPGGRVDLCQQERADLTNLVHSRQMVVGAGVVLPKQNKRGCLRNGQRSALFKAACTEVLDELQCSIRHLSTVSSLADAVRKMQEVRKRFLQMTEQAVQRVRISELASTIQTHQECCGRSEKLNLTGSIYTRCSTFGDFQWMIATDVHPRALYIFNDNDKDHYTSSRGCGNAAIRPYNRYNLHRSGIPRSAGVSTGLSSRRGGFQALDAGVSAIIDRDISEIKDLLSTGCYDSVIYSADSDGVTLGTGIFRVARQVKDYILAHLKEFDGKTVAEFKEYQGPRQALQAKAPPVSWIEHLITAHDQLVFLENTFAAMDAVLALLTPTCTEAALQKLFCKVTHLQCSANLAFISASDMRCKREQLMAARNVAALSLAMAKNPTKDVWLAVARQLFVSADDKVKASLAFLESPRLPLLGVCELFCACVMRAAWSWKLRSAFDRSYDLQRHASGSHWHIDLSVAPVSLRVQQSFLAEWFRMPDAVDNFKLAFHGTSCANLSSIYSKGLLIPGKANNLQVKNGSAHGLGIYLADLNAVDLSLGFADCGGVQYDGRRQLGLLVCGVLDDSRPCQTDRAGRFLVPSASASIRHVGDAFVVFNTSRVVPLFVVSLRPGPYAVSMHTSMRF